jgi:hypothetical protein
MIKNQAPHLKKILIQKIIQDQRKFLLLKISEKLTTNQVKVQVRIKVIINQKKKTQFKKAIVLAI